MKKIFSLFFVSILIISGLSSCSFIGYGTGLYFESAPSHDTIAIFTDVKSCKGQDARIIFRDSIESATFVDYADEPEQQYRKRYGHDTANVLVPFGSKVSVVEDYSTFSKGSFGGFFPEGIILADKKIYFDDFDGIKVPTYIKKDSLKNRFTANAIPIRAKLYFRTKEKSFSITNRDFQNVFIMPYTSFPWRWIGAAIGLSLDIYLIILGIHHINIPL